MTRITTWSAVGVLALVASVAPTSAQTLERRVSSANGDVTFNFPSREEVCGDGRTYMRVDGSMWMGTINDAVRMQPCERGPVRVLLVRDGSDLLRIESFAGPLSRTEGATDLGAVPATEAVSYLLGVAARAEGRPARDAITPAMLAEGASVTQPLLAIVRDNDRPREVRRSALSWLVRRRDEPGGMPAAEMTRTLTQIARDESEARTVRDQALSSLSRLESAVALEALVTMSTNANEAWLARRATEVLASSGDPRARQHLRAAAERTDLAEEARAAAIRGIGGGFATSRDAEFLRGLYPRVSTDRLRDAILTAVASIGGRTSREWILGIARDEDQPIASRRRAVSMAEQLGMSAADLASLYDGIENGEVRAHIISQLASNGTRAASDKLILIARNDPLVSNRRRAIQALGRFDDARVKEALRELVGGR